VKQQTADDTEPAAQPDTAEVADSATPSRKRQKRAEPTRASAQKQASKKTTRRSSRTSARERSATAEPEAGPSHATPEPERVPAGTAARSGQGRRSQSATATPAEPAPPVPRTPRKRVSTRAPAAAAVPSPTRARQEPIILMSSCAPPLIATCALHTAGVLQAEVVTSSCYKLKGKK
jgi:hypothetical protein